MQLVNLRWFFEFHTGQAEIQSWKLVEIVLTPGQFNYITYITISLTSPIVAAISL